MQTELRKRSGLEERLKVSHAQLLSSFLANSQARWDHWG